VRSSSLDGKTRQLSDTIQKLEAKVAQLQKALSVAGHTTTLHVGSSSISLSPAKIEIKSNEITLSGSGKITVKAAGQLMLKGSTIVQN
jgi:type VI secretion system secreted protein VgrG